MIELELKNGKRQKFNSQVAKVLIARGMGKEVGSQGYMTREMRPSVPAPQVEPETEKSDDAPWGYKSDGTPRKRPGRPAASE